MNQQRSKTSDPTKINQSSDKLLGLLEVMSLQSEPLRLQDAARLTNMNSSTALRFLAALQQRSYVAQDENGRYFLTYRLCNLARNITSNMSIRNISLPFLRNVAHIFSESCNLAIENEMSALYIEAENCGNKALTSAQRIGHIAPLHCTGVGKLFLMEYTMSELDHLIAVKGLPSFTKYTISDKEALLEELNKIRRVGYAFDNEECDEGVRCIAASIRDYTGKIKAGISVSGPAVRMTDTHILSHLPFLLDAAEQISIRLGWLKDEKNT